MVQSSEATSRLHAAPGTLHVPADSPAPTIRRIEYSKSEVDERDVTDLSELADHADLEKKLWIDVQGLGDAAQLRQIAKHLGIHALAIADAVNVPQRAKTQVYGDYVLTIMRAPLDPFDPNVRVPQVAILFSERIVVSFQERRFGFFDGVRDRLRTAGSELRKAGPAKLAHALVDACVDQYYPVVENLSERLDDLDALIFSDPSPELFEELHGLQRAVTVLRRVARPQVEAIHQLRRVESAQIPDSARLFFLDAEDHAQQILGRLDALRDMATDAMNAALATLGHRQNEIMKVLTLVGSIFIPLTFIAGIYGMNFEHMPELKVRSGYPTALTAMLFIAVLMVGYFRYRGWIGNRSRRNR